MRRFMGIDYGSRRMGLALGDDVLRLASPLTTIEVSGRHLDDVKSVLILANEYDVAEFVVGLPVNMDDSFGYQAEVTIRFAELLSKHSGKAVHQMDERLSSVAADDLLQPAGLTNKKHKSKRDRVAAQIILQDFLDSLE